LILELHKQITLRKVEKILPYIWSCNAHSFKIVLMVRVLMVLQEILVWTQDKEWSNSLIYCYMQ